MDASIRKSMKNLPLLSGTLIGLGLALSATAQAELVQFDITGIGSGTLNGTPFTNDAFDIRMLGDNSTVETSSDGQDTQINPLTSVSIILSGLGTSVISTPTRLGLATCCGSPGAPVQGAIYFS